MKISEDFKKKLIRFNSYLLSITEDGLIWNMSIYDFDEIDYSDGPYSANNYHQKINLSKFTEEVKYFEELIDDHIKNSDISSYLNDDNCTGSANLTVTYLPNKYVFNFDLSVYTIDTIEYENIITFKEISNKVSTYSFREYTYLKKFGDKSIIENWKNEYGNVINVTYDGGGDSGQINDSDKYSEDFEYAIYEIIDLYHSGWEINEGSAGEILINFTDQLIKISHNQNTEDSFIKELPTIKLFE